MKPARSDLDLLTEILRERTRGNPTFPELVDAAGNRRRLGRRLAEERERRGLTQTAIAALMGTSQSAVARLEAGARDVRLSTLERYAAVLGRRFEWRLVTSKDSVGRRAGARSRRATA